MNKHFSWCDQGRCDGEPQYVPTTAHRSRPFGGTTLSAAEDRAAVELCAGTGPAVYVNFAFDGAEYEEHQVIPHQAHELLDTFRAIVAELEPTDFEPEDVEGFTAHIAKLDRCRTEHARQQEAARHPRWCDPHRCAAQRPHAIRAEHTSRLYRGTFDPDTGLAIDTAIYRQLTPYTYLQLTFNGAWCASHHLSVRQTNELVKVLPALLAQLSPPALIDLAAERAARNPSGARANRKRRAAGRRAADNP